jgi:hypothetical protein
MTPAKPTHPNPAEAPVLGARLDPIVRWSALAAVLGAVGLVGGFIVDPTQAFVGYLAAFVYVVTIGLGALTLLMTCHAMTALWPVVVRRIMEAIALALPLCVVLFIPVLIGFGRLYPWAHPDTIVDAQARELVVHKLPYLNLPFWIARAVVYFGVWTVTVGLLWRWSVLSEASPDPRLTSRMRALSSAMLPAVALTLTFAAIDWVMSLTPTWISTMYGIYVWSGGFIAAISLVTVLAYAAQSSGLLPWVSPSHYHALGRLMLAFTIFWAYAGFFQYMLIWIGNLPIDVPFYVERTRGTWATVSSFLALGQFVVPFFALLPWRIKRNGKQLAVMAAWLVFIHYIDAHWLVAPSARLAGSPYRWVDLAALLFVAGLTTLGITLLLRKRPILPINDPALAVGLGYESL